MAACIGVKHPSWSWHAGLLFAEIGAIAINLPWLIDWASYWWLRLPLPNEKGPILPKLDRPFLETALAIATGYPKPRP